jgi:hypothetical protein
MPFASNKPDEKFEVDVLKKLKDNAKLNTTARPVRIAGPYAGIVDTINTVKKNTEYLNLVDVVAAQALDGKNFDRKKLGELSNLAHDAKKWASVNGINDWEAEAKTQKNNDMYKDKDGKAKKVKKDKDAEKKNPAAKGKNKNNGPIANALYTGFDQVISGAAINRLISPLVSRLTS